MSRTNLINKANQLKKRLNGASTRDAAKRLGLSHSSIAQTLSLLKLPDLVQKFLQEGKITKTHAKLLYPLTPDKQLHFASLAISEKLSVRALEAAIKGSCQRNVSSDTEKLERLISEKLGAPVIFNERKKQMVIKYQDLEVLDGVLENMGINVNEAY